MNTNFLEHIINSLPVFIAYINNDEKYEFINYEYRNWLGLSEEEIIGKNVREVLGGKRYEKIEGHLKMALLGKDVAYEVTMPENKIFFARYIPVINSDKTIEGVSILVEDITEKKLLEADKNDLILKLTKSADEIKTLKGIIPICSYCHNIRDEKGAWNKLETYITKHSKAEFSHGICPICLEKAKSEAGLE